jgi:hypothetical protein
LCTLSLGTSHTHTENSCNIFNGHWNSIDHFLALSVTLVSNWVLTKECNWKSKKRKQAHKYRCLRSGWMWMKFPETSIFDELVRREKFQLWWTATTLLVKHLSIHSFRSTAKLKRQDLLKSAYVQLIWPCRCCFFSRKYAGYMRFLDNLLSSFKWLLLNCKNLFIRVIPRFQWWYKWYSVIAFQDLDSKSVEVVYIHMYVPSDGLRVEGLEDI